MDVFQGLLMHRLHVLRGRRVAVHVRLAARYVWGLAVDLAMFEMTIKVG